MWNSQGRLATLEYSPAGTLLMVHDWKTMHVYDAANHASLASIPRGELSTNESFAPDDSRLAVATATAPVQLFDPRSGALLGQLGAATDGIGNVLHSPDGNELATSGGTTIVLWDAATATARLSLPDSSDIVSLAYSPDGRRLAGSRGRDGVSVWDTGSGELVVHIEPEAHDTGTGTLSFTPDGTRLLIAGSGIRMHDVASGTLLRSIDSLLEQPPHVSRDGTRLTLVDTEARLEVWDLVSGELATRERVGARRADGSVAWPLPTPELVRIGCTRLRVFTTAYPLVRALCDPLVGG
jgi:WD40 repeat protein